MENVFVGGFARTPIGGFDGSLGTLTAEKLAVEAIHAVMTETGLSPNKISEVIVGNAKQTSTTPIWGGMSLWMRIFRRRHPPIQSRDRMHPECRL